MADMNEGAPLMRIVQSNATGSRAAAATRCVRGWRKFLVDLRYIWLEQILEVRNSWYLLLVFSLVMPVSMVFGFARIGSGLSDSAGLLRIITGAAVFAVANEGIVVLAHRVGVMKRDGMLMYYAALPISKGAFIIAILCSRLAMTLPSMLVSII